jgi:hypothetical protein
MTGLLGRHPTHRRPGLLVTRNMNKKKYLEELEIDLKKSVAYFAPQNKAEREIWVVREFLTNLGIPFLPNELKSIKDDPPDVRFLNAEFEIKEILDKNRQRHREYKEALRKVATAQGPDDFFEQYMPRDIPTSGVYNLIYGRSLELHPKYPLATRNILDLLFYVNLQDYSLDLNHPFPDIFELIDHGWRSVSFLMYFQSCILYASNNAPDFIKQHAGKVISRGRSGTPSD